MDKKRLSIIVIIISIAGLIAGVVLTGRLQYRRASASGGVKISLTQAGNTTVYVLFDTNSKTVSAVDLTINHSSNIRIKDVALGNLLTEVLQNPVVDAPAHAVSVVLGAKCDTKCNFYKGSGILVTLNLERLDNASAELSISPKTKVAALDNNENSLGETKSLTLPQVIPPTLPQVLPPVEL